MEVGELKTAMEQQFAWVDERFKQVDERAGRLTAVNAEDHVRFQAYLENHERRLADLERQSES